MIELMISVAIIGILAAIGLPLFAKHQMRTRSSEAKVNLSAIRVVQESQFAESGVYVAAAAEPPAVPGRQTAAFDYAGSDFLELGWSPEGRVFFSYATTVVLPGATGFTADAAADLDTDGVLQIWGYEKPNVDGVSINGALGCDVTTIVSRQVSPCFSGNSIF